MCMETWRQDPNSISLSLICCFRLAAFQFLQLALRYRLSFCCTLMAMMNQEEVKSEKIELWTVGLKYLGFHSQIEVGSHKA